MAKSVLDVYRENLGQAIFVNVGGIIAFIILFKLITDAKGE